MNDDLVNASELREFLYCERSWWLARRGFDVSTRAERAREAGVLFHEQRAAAAASGGNPYALRLAVALVLIALALILAKALLH